MDDEIAGIEARQVCVTLDDFREGQVATVTICNASRLNTMNSAMMDEFIEELAALAENNELRAVVLTGDGEKAFIGGADIKEMAALRDPSRARAFISRVHACLAAVRDIQVPTIARIQGYAFGAGLEMAAACDFRVVSDSAVFGMPEVRLGIPSVAEAALLPMLVGWGRTRQMLLLGESFTAAQALEWKFVEQVTPRDQLDDAVQALVRQALDCAPAAVRLQKSLIRAWEDLPRRAAIAAGIDTFASAYNTDEPQSRMREFLAMQARRKARG
ncbi:enoyl-CoA hydratase [Bradyrhizobium paxllaeri]|uniref:enoyl-CoA hydratase n=1 Tax=Bradyrhizobium paxllaeri TaxID=190148 RepID=UPI0008109033|nr:enoyl-CoA hydratase [Bradyrhizobium paxllaeri]